jgi:HEAT repeat protein
VSDARVEQTPDELLRIAQAGDEPDDIRERAVWDLARIAPQRVLELSDLIFDETAPEMVRGEVALKLEYVEDPRVVTILRKGLARDLPEVVRYLSASALGFHPFTKDEAIADLVAILLDTSDAAEVRGHAAEALAHTFHWHGIRPVPREVARALRATVDDPDDVVRIEAIWALAQTAKVHDIPLLERLLAAEGARENAPGWLLDDVAEAIQYLYSRKRKPA